MHLDYAIIDDDSASAAQLREWLIPLPELSWRACHHDLVTAGRELETSPPDILFINPHLAKGEAFNFPASLPRVPATIYLATNEDFAARAFKVNAIDYLVKPLRPERVNEAVRRAITRHLARLDEPRGDTIVIRANRQSHRIPVGSILYVRSMREYVVFHLRDGRRIMTLQPLHRLMVTLRPAGFLRIHRSYAVAKHHITALGPRSVHLGGIELGVGRSYLVAVREVLRKRFTNPGSF